MCARQREQKGQAASSAHAYPEGSLGHTPSQILTRIPIPPYLRTHGGGGKGPQVLSHGGGVKSR